MAKTRVKDTYIEMEITASTAPSVTGSTVINIQRALAVLHATIPMASYNIARVGVTNVWNVTAVAQDTREYAKTISIPADEPFYTLASFPAGTALELSVFLSLAQLFAKILKANGVSAVAITWVVV